MNICECGCDKDLTMNGECPICPDAIESTETAGYVPFDAEWEKEMMKMTKKQLVEMLKNALKGA